MSDAGQVETQGTATPVPGRLDVHARYVGRFSFTDLMDSGPRVALNVASDEGVMILWGGPRPLVPPSGWGVIASVASPFGDDSDELDALSAQYSLSAAYVNLLDYDAESLVATTSGDIVPIFGEDVWISARWDQASVDWSLVWDTGSTMANRIISIEVDSTDEAFQSASGSADGTGLAGAGGAGLLTFTIDDAGTETYSVNDLVLFTGLDDADDPTTDARWGSAVLKVTAVNGSDFPTTMTVEWAGGGCIVDRQMSAVGGDALITVDTVSATGTEPDWEGLMDAVTADVISGTVVLGDGNLSWQYVDPKATVMTDVVDGDVDLYALVVG